MTEHDVHAGLSEVGGARWRRSIPPISIATRALSYTATIGSRKFDLRADGNNNMVGTVVIGGQSLPFVLEGVSELWSMPASDQVAILPMVLTCEDAIGESKELTDFTQPAVLSVSFAANHLVR